MTRLHMQGFTVYAKGISAYYPLPKVHKFILVHNFFFFSLLAAVVRGGGSFVAAGSPHVR